MSDRGEEIKVGKPTPVPEGYTVEQLKGLDHIQNEIREWTKVQFGENVSRDDASIAHGHPLGSLCPLMGIGEEYGELLHATVYRHQGRGYHGLEGLAEHRKDKADAVADLLIYLLCYAGMENIDVLSELNLAWGKVSRRRQSTWLADKAKEKTDTKE